MENSSEHPTPQDPDEEGPTEESAGSEAQSSDAASPPVEQFDEDPSRNPDSPEMKRLQGG